MQRAIKALLFLTAMAVVCAPMQARADGYVAPWAGTNWGSNIDNGRGVFGVSAGFMGDGIIGGEFDFGYSPSFFGNQSDFGHNTVITTMGNLVVGIPVGGTHGAGIRPYVTGGAGLFRSQIDGGTVFHVSSSNNDLGWNAGAGVMGYVSEHFGLRGDIRYIRDTNNDNGGIHFWRLGFGIVIR